MTEIITLEQAAELLLQALIAIGIGGFANAPITTFLVSVGKHIPALNSIPATMIQFVVGLTLTAVFWVAQYLGAEAAFNSVMDIIVAAGPAILALLSALVGSNALYQVSKGRAGFIGYEREDTAQEPVAHVHG